MVESNSFCAPPEVHSFSGLLFDLDGTLVDSTEAIVKHWHKIGKELNVDPEEILITSHGRRSIDTLAIYDSTKANWDYVKFIEGRIPIEYGQSAVLIPGGNAILQSLEEADAPWAIVTSGTRALAIGWLDVLKLAHPEHLVVAEDVPNGKPDPACYLLGRQNLGLALEDPVLVIEDAPAGIKAGKAAGCKVLSLTTTHSAAQVRAAGADWILRDLRDLQLKSWDKGSRRLTVEIANALQD